MKKFYIVSFLLLTSVCYSQSSCPGIDSLNYGSLWYHTVQIGSQCWLKENLNIGKMIPAVSNQVNTDSDIQKFCYNNDPAMCDKFGGLYQWWQMMQYSGKQGTRGICPVGWHIPQITEFDTLRASVNGDGNALKSIGEGQGTNTSGFSALLAGQDSLTSFSDIGIRANFWTCASHRNNNYYVLYGTRLVIDTLPSITHNDYNTAYEGLNVRCLRDNDGLLLQSPYGGEGWSVGSTKNITWGGFNVSDIKIELTTDNGINWSTIIVATPASTGSYSWTVPNTVSINCKIRISDVNNPGTSSMSDNVFTIYDSCPEGILIDHGGKKYKTVAIGGRCWFKENVNIGTIIPGSQSSAQNGIIEKYCYNDDTTNCTTYGGLYPYSEIREPGFCPAGWHIETIWDVLSKSHFDTNSLLELGQGSGFGSGTNISGFSALLAGYRSGTGFSALGNTAYFGVGTFMYHWLIAFSLSGGSVYEDDHFDINAGVSFRCVWDNPGKLSIVSPVSGENCYVDSIYNITWGNINVPNVKIDYTTDNGVSWINIIASAPSISNNYSWKIPNTTSINCKVRVSDVLNPDTCTISSSVFNICAALPVELTSFTASIINSNVNLNWLTATETNTLSFNIEKKTVNNNTWQNIASLKSSGTSNSPKQYSYTDKNVSTGKYNYRLKMVDLDGSFKYSNIITAEVTPPAKYELSNAYPNPWNPTTTIHYQVPVNILVSIKVFDALGREVSTLVNEVKPAGSYDVTLNGRNLASGIYYYQMKAGNFIETKKITLIK